MVIKMSLIANAEIDLHSFTVSEAKKYLDSFLNGLPKTTKEVTVIHGCNRGTALLKYVRVTYNHKRIDRKIMSLNQGTTIFLLK